MVEPSGTNFNQEHASSNRSQVGLYNGRSLPTFYNGVTFRSRTEARWAVFMDELGLRWAYESEGFDLGSGRYVPDFWVPDLGAGSFLEIKPAAKKFDQEASEKCADLATLTGFRVYLIQGAPHDQESDLSSRWYDTESAYMHHEGGGMDTHYLWCVCPDCGKPGLQFDGRGARVCGDRCSGSTGRHGDKGYTFDHPRILEAAAVARVWRFR